jgi:catechol 2,3-dioxygenase-like lactoylglutathione lyase family enzyme
VSPVAELGAVHHVGVQTADLDRSVAWYRAFLGAEVVWSLEDFSATTLGRLPGIRRLVEIAAGDVRLHLFEREAAEAPDAAGRPVSFQHVCLAVRRREDLDRFRERAVELTRAGGHPFARGDEPTEIETDAAGISSFYVFDVDGLELELAFHGEAHGGVPEAPA